MKTDHIAQERMQEILDGAADPMTPAENRHLKQCIDCSRIYGEYGMLMPQLAVVRFDPLPADFASGVLAMLPVERSHDAPGPIMFWLGLGVLVTGLLAVLQVIYGLFSGFSGSLGRLMGSFGEVLVGGSSLMRGLSGETLGLVVIIPFCFALVGLLDRIIRKRYPMVRG